MRLSKPLLALASAALLASSATALVELGYGSRDISVVLQQGDDVAYHIPMKAGDFLAVDLEVTSGGPADFYLTDLAAYKAYKASIAGNAQIQSLYYVVEYSRESSDGISFDYDSLADTDFVLIVDNTGFTESGAAPVGPVTVEGKVLVERGVWSLRNIAIAVAVVIGFVLFMAYLRWPKRKP